VPETSSPPHTDYRRDHTTETGPPEIDHGSERVAQNGSQDSMEHVYGDVNQNYFAEWDARVPPDFPDSPSDLAAARQQPPDYPQEDQWRDRQAQPGERLWTAPKESQNPQDPVGYTNYGVFEGDLNDVHKDAEAYREMAQMKDTPSRLDCYEFKRSCEIATAPVQANDVRGSGGTEQVFIPGMQKRIDDGTLVLVGSYKFDPRS
jgi:hypothetical protein